MIITPYKEKLFLHLSTLIEVCDPIYPGIDLWFDRKVMPGLCNNSRCAWLCFECYCLVGGYVVKHKSPTKIKLCTLRVVEPWRNLGYGTKIMEHVITTYGYKELYFTAPEPIALGYKDWFAKFGFVWHGKADKQATAYGDEILFVRLTWKGR